ncbi:MAG: isoamylase early set domain-containing protein [Gemmatimonadota bacterium]|jgi:hypothetical protein
MREEIRRYLDGEVGMDGVPEGMRAEAQAWDSLLASVKEEMPRGTAPPWLEQRVMADIDALPARAKWPRIVAWLLRPQPVRITPLVGGLAVAGLAVLLLWLGPFGSRPPRATPGEDIMVYVQFALEAPEARSVAVGGDFDAWGGSHPLSDPDGDGVWTGRIPVRPGVHAYMFLVDGSEWVTDPQADRYADDGFGNQNAVLAVATPST